MHISISVPRYSFAIAARNSLLPGKNYDRTTDNPASVIGIVESSLLCFRSIAVKHHNITNDSVPALPGSRMIGRAGFGANIRFFPFITKYGNVAFVTIQLFQLSLYHN